MTRPAAPRSLVLCAWLTADVFSLFGSRISGIAIPWFVLTSTGSAALTGAVGATQLATMVVARFLAGPIIDRVGPIRSAVTADLASAAAIALVPLLWSVDRLPIAALLAIVAVVGALRGPADSAKSVLVVPLASATGQPLERMTGLAGTTERLASTIGLAVGGVVVAAVGGPAALVLTSAGLLTGATLTGTIVARALRSTPSGEISRQAGSRRPRYLADLFAGWGVIRRTPMLLALALIPAVTNMFDAAFSEVLMPAWTIERGEDAQVLGYLFASFSIAAVAGSALATAFATRLPRFPMYLVGFFVAGAPRFVVMALGVDLRWVVVTLVVGGLGAGFINPILGAVQFERIPASMRGRVISTSSALGWSLMPVGSLAGGFAATHAGLPLTLIVIGISYLVVTMLPAVIPAWRDFDRITSRSEPMQRP